MTFCLQVEIECLDSNAHSLLYQILGRYIYLGVWGPATSLLLGRSVKPDVASRMPGEVC